MKKRNRFTFSLMAFFAGTVFGFLLAPSKGGFGNNITTNYYIKEPAKTD